MSCFAPIILFIRLFPPEPIADNFCPEILDLENTGMLCEKLKQLQNENLYTLIIDHKKCKEKSDRIVKLISFNGSLVFIYDFTNINCILQVAINSYMAQMKDNYRHNDKNIIIIVVFREKKVIQLL